ncbi:MAG: LytTR family DNA-binding domain-containing protein [Lachnospiraceae bacterium]|nr:LytTR family DNA-binding domain-containing protein [Lachnospiraceae bacterium]
MDYKIAVCDDEQNQIEYLSSLVRDWAKQCGCTARIVPFLSAEAFWFQYEGEKDYDILLLDIEMKQMNGIELARQLRASDESIQIILITGYPDYIAQGYEVAALHYLMKPVSREKLSAVLKRAVTNLHKKERSILVWCGKDCQRIVTDTIVYVEVLSHKVTIYTTDKEYRTKCSISEMEQLLGDDFIRCHRSYLAGLKHIARMTKSEVVFEDGRSVPLARSAYHMANQAFIQYYKEI